MSLIILFSDSIFSSFNFKLESFGYSGSLKIHNKSGKPESLSLKSDNSDSIIYIIFESILDKQFFQYSF